MDLLKHDCALPITSTLNRADKAIASVIINGKTTPTNKVIIALSMNYKTFFFFFLFNIVTA